PTWRSRYGEAEGPGRAGVCRGGGVRRCVSSWTGGGGGGQGRGGGGGWRGRRGREAGGQLQGAQREALLRSGRDGAPHQGRRVQGVRRVGRDVPGRGGI